MGNDNRRESLRGRGWKRSPARLEEGQREDEQDRREDDGNKERQDDFQGGEGHFRNFVEEPTIRGGRGDGLLSSIAPTGDGRDHLRVLRLRTPRGGLPLRDPRGDGRGGQGNWNHQGAQVFR